MRPLVGEERDMTRVVTTRLQTGAGVLLLRGSLMLLSCSTAQQALKAKPAPTTSRFLPQPERMTEQRERFPFHQAWIKAGMARAKAQGKRISRAPIPEGAQHRIWDLYQRGRSLHQISRQLAIGYGTVWNYVHRLKRDPT